MKKVIYQDQRVAEEFCNFRCDYCEGFCPSGYSLIKDKNSNLNVPKEWYEKINLLPIEAKKYFENGSKMENFYSLCLNILEKTSVILQADILKISGGEITTNENLVNFIKKIHKNYPSIQILTNGFNIKEEEIKEYRKMGNISFQISIDGVTADSNYAKSHNAKITEKVIENIEIMIREELGVEINCVLTKYNTDKFLEFLERFKDANNLIIVPRPVRGKPKEILNFSKKQVELFEVIINDNFDKYSKILPPKEYFSRLIEIMRMDRRNTECYIPFYVESIDSYGNIEECPIGLITESNYNVFEKQKDDNVVIKKHIFRDNSLCQNCTNQYEMFNLYVEGKITREELKKMPSLNSDKILTHIDEIKEEIVQKELSRVLKEIYDLDIKKIIKSDQSTDNNVYKIYCNQKKYIVKIYNNIAHTESMVNLHNKLIMSKINIPKIIQTKDKENYTKILEGYYVVVYSFINGKQIGWNEQTGKLDKETIISIAKELRKIHKLTSNNNEFNLPMLPFENNNIRKSVLHFDLTRNNIFKNSKNGISIIDFDDAKYGDSICDIAILIANLFFSKTRGVDLDGMKEFINQYYIDEIDLKNKEESLIKKYALEWIKYILDGNEFDTSTTESFEIRYKLINENL